MALLTPKQYLEQVALGQAALQKAKLDYAVLVENYDALASKIIAELSQVEADLDTLQDLQDLVFAQGKENSQHINSFLGFTVTGNLATTKAHVTSAKNSIRSKG